MKKKKSGQTIHSCSMQVPYAGLWAVIYSVITRVLIARFSDSVFKLNLTNFRARGCKLAHAVRRLVHKRANPRLRTAQILSSLWSIVWMDKFTQKLCQNARLGKYPSRHSRLNVQYQCILLKWQHFLNINQKEQQQRNHSLLLI